MERTAYTPYAPLSTPKPFAPEVWVVDGPEIAMQVMGLSMPFPTRMTIVRLPDGELWVHSPIAWDERLAAAVARLGRVAHIVAPNTLHYWYVAEWQARFPDVRTYAAPDLARRAKRPVAIDETLNDAPPPAWRGVIEQQVVRGPVLTEVIFFHRPSRTLILTDLIENFEPSRIRNPWLRRLMRLFGPTDPDGKAPFDMRLSFLGRKRTVRAAARRMIGWAPERVILAHGRCYTENGVAELKRAFRWALPR